MTDPTEEAEMQSMEEIMEGKSASSTKMPPHRQVREKATALAIKQYSGWLDPRCVELAGRIVDAIEEADRRALDASPGFSIMERNTRINRAMAASLRDQGTQPDTRTISPRAFEELQADVRRAHDRCNLIDQRLDDLDEAVSVLKHNEAERASVCIPGDDAA